MKTAETILEDLKSRGYKNTKVREAIIQTLIGSNTPFSIADILNILSDKGLKPNKTTVYREISFLRDLDIVQEVNFGDGRKMYEISEDHHHHIRCIGCNLIKDIPMDHELNAKEEKILNQTGFKPTGHTLEFFGLCSNCQ